MVIVSLVILSLCVPTGAPVHNPPEVPAFARVLGLRVGMDTLDRLERRLGKGRTVTGGHSNSGRSWKFRNGLPLFADGFDLPRNGANVITGSHYVLDTLLFQG